jgi:hypothetical protein
MSADELSALLRRVSNAPDRELEKLITQLQKLRTQLHNAGNRILLGVGVWALTNLKSSSGPASP